MDFDYQQWWSGLTPTLKRDIVSELYYDGRLTMGTEVVAMPEDIDEKIVACTELSLAQLRMGEDSCSFLQPFVNLRKLSLQMAKHLTDISMLANLQNLEAIQLVGCKQVDMSALANLQNLRSLTVTNAILTNIDSLRNLTSLKTLDLTGSSENVGRINLTLTKEYLQEILLDTPNFSELFILTKKIIT